MSPLPVPFRGTPQALADAIVARLSLETEETLALFRNGGSEPSSDMGPWLKDGNKWYVWSADDGAYVPVISEFRSDLNPKPFRGNLTAQTDLVFAAPGAQAVNLVFTEEYDPEGVFATSLFTAPETGYYHINAKVGAGVTTGTPTDNVVIVYLTKNGTQMAMETSFIQLVDSTSGRTYAISTDLKLNAGDQIGVGVNVAVGGGSGTWSITQNDTWFSGHKICNSPF